MAAGVRVDAPVMKHYGMRSAAAGGEALHRSRLGSLVSQEAKVKTWLFTVGNARPPRPGQEGICKRRPGGGSQPLRLQIRFKAAQSAQSTEKIYSQV